VNGSPGSFAATPVWDRQSSNIPAGFVAGKMDHTATTHQENLSNWKAGKPMFDERQHNGGDGLLWYDSRRMRVLR
jgi:hypothetical protein